MRQRRAFWTRMPARSSICAMPVCATTRPRSVTSSAWTRMTVRSPSPSSTGQPLPYDSEARRCAPRASARSTCPSRSGSGRRDAQAASASVIVRTGPAGLTTMSAANSALGAASSSSVARRAGRSSPARSALAVSASTSAHVITRPPSIARCSSAAFARREADERLPHRAVDQRRLEITGGLGAHERAGMLQVDHVGDRHGARLRGAQVAGETLDAVELVRRVRRW